MFSCLHCNSFTWFLSVLIILSRFGSAGWTRCQIENHLFVRVCVCWGCFLECHAVWSTTALTFPFLEIFLHALSHSLILLIYLCGKCLLFMFDCVSFSFFLSFLEVHCPPIVTLKHISLSPPACGENEVRTGASCQLTCPRGYSLIGSSEVRCLPSGSWSGNLHKATCTGDLFSVCVYNDKQYYVLHETSLFVLL